MKLSHQYAKLSNTKSGVETLRETIFLAQKVAFVTVAQGVVVSRLSCYHPLFFGMPNFNIIGIQRSGYRKAYLLSNTCVHHQMTPILQTPYWLDINNAWTMSKLMMFWLSLWIIADGPISYVVVLSSTLINRRIIIINLCSTNKSLCKYLVTIQILVIIPIS